MGENSKIEWTDATWNPWRGCSKVSDGCRWCYAEAMSKRFNGFGVWGDSGTRVIASESMWRQPLKWNEEAERAGERRRVFCASLADVFEDREELHAPRERLFRLIEKTPFLDWLLLTKRPENIQTLHRVAMGYSISDAYHNVFFGTSVENQATADERIPHLLKVPAAVRFLSCEPLLGPVDLRCVRYDGMVDIDALTGDHGVIRPLRGRSENRIHWVICGGESGPHARPMNEGWVRSLRDQCVSAKVAFFYKQKLVNGHKVGLPLLDGRTWDEFPTEQNRAEVEK